MAINKFIKVYNGQFHLQKWIKIRRYPHFGKAPAWHEPKIGMANRSRCIPTIHREMMGDQGIQQPFFGAKITTSWSAVLSHVQLLPGSSQPTIWEPDPFKILLRVS
jgi:hypothetical protein